MTRNVIIGLVAALGACILAGIMFSCGPHVSAEVKAFAKEFRAAPNNEGRANVLDRHVEAWNKGLEGLSGRTVRRRLGPPDDIDKEKKRETLYYHTVGMKGVQCDLTIVLDEKKRVAMTIYD